MNKELTPLETSKQLKDFVLKSTTNGLNRRVIIGSFEIIDTALKDYEKKTKLAKKYKDVNNVAKRLKALEIIKEKKVDTYILIFAIDRFEDRALDYYNYNTPTYRLTQEEFDLLKEVLKDERRRDNID